MSERRRVLIIDDDREIVRGLSVRMRAAKYEVISAYDGQSGLRLALERLPDAIILDIRMPVMDGLEVLAKLREEPCTKSIPVVVISANVLENTRSSALDLGARCFLSKPYQHQTLLAAVDSMTKNKQHLEFAANMPCHSAPPFETDHD